MSGKGAVLFAAILLAALALPQGVHAADEEIQKKVDALSKEVQALQKQVAQSKEGKKSIGDWLTIGGDYRFKIDSLRGEVAPYFAFTGPTTPPIQEDGFKVKNDTVQTHRLGLNLKAKVTQNVNMTVRLLSYKISGSQDASAISGLADFPAPGVKAPFFADRVGVFDGTLGHVPSSGTLDVDQAYVTWSNIADQPIWFSIGRRPSTGGTPSHLRQNNERPGNGGIPAILVDYAFDGLALGVAPDFDALPGAYAKLCYGRGFENGFTRSSGNGMRDTDFLGISVTPYDTDRLYVNLQWDRGFNIFDAPVMSTDTFFGNTKPSTRLGDLDWYGITLVSTLKNIGPGTLNLFASGAASITHPNDNRSQGAGLLLAPGEAKADKTGEALYVGARYDFNKNRTKVGAEYNYGTKNWVGFVPAGDDLWTSKLGVRGSVYEGYVIQELNVPAVASFLAKTFFRLGYQYYDFKYTGSNGWVGAPVKIADLASSPNFTQLFIPLKNAHDIYATMEVKF